MSIHSLDADVLRHVLQDLDTAASLSLTCKHFQSLLTPLLPSFLGTRQVRLLVFYPMEIPPIQMTRWGVATPTATAPGVYAFKKLGPDGRILPGMTCTDTWQDSRLSSTLVVQGKRRLDWLSDDMLVCILHEALEAFAVCGTDLGRRARYTVEQLLSTVQSSGVLLSHMDVAKRISYGVMLTVLGCARDCVSEEEADARLDTLRKEQMNFLMGCVNARWCNDAVKVWRAKQIGYLLDGDNSKGASRLAAHLFKK